MSPEATAIMRVLLKHHRQVCRRDAPVESCLIVYGLLCDRAGVPFLTRSVGHFLGEVAEWCAAHKWPPINSLAVNQDSRMPGEGYEVAKGCSLLTWPQEVRACIDFEGYPDAVS